MLLQGVECLSLPTSSPPLLRFSESSEAQHVRVGGHLASAAQQLGWQCVSACLLRSRRGTEPGHRQYCRKIPRGECSAWNDVLKDLSMREGGAVAIATKGSALI